MQRAKSNSNFSLRRSPASAKFLRCGIPRDDPAATQPRKPGDAAYPNFQARVLTAHANNPQVPATTPPPLPPSQRGQPIHGRQPSSRSLENTDFRVATSKYQLLKSVHQDGRLSLAGSYGPCWLHLGIAASILDFLPSHRFCWLHIRLATSILALLPSYRLCCPHIVFGGFI